MELSPSACRDIVGKTSLQPLVNLFGVRVRDEVEFFFYLSRKWQLRWGVDAAAGVKAGFRTLYLKVGSDNPSDDIERVEAVRDAAGRDALIRLEANEASWTRYNQLEVIRASAADVVSIDNWMDGGLLNMKRGASVSSASLRTPAST
jgi:L-alanine-DL-glutamate epimerase-like enolase superfamily enzyme